MTSNGSDRLTRIEAIVESNSRAIQAMMDQRVQERLEHEQRMQRLEEILNRVANVQEGLGRMLVSLDDDRPTILRKLNSIENKVDRLLNGDRG
jgi:tetrahydromethanopterin S-methyltransferase subunit G